MIENPRDIDQSGFGRNSIRLVLILIGVLGTAFSIWAKHGGMWSSQPRIPISIYSVESGGEEGRPMVVARHTGEAKLEGVEIVAVAGDGQILCLHRDEWVPGDMMTIGDLVRLRAGGSVEVEVAAKGYSSKHAKF